MCELVHTTCFGCDAFVEVKQACGDFFEHTEMLTARMDMCTHHTVPAAKTALQYRISPHLDPGCVSLLDIQIPPTATSIDAELQTLGKCVLANVT